jgi:NADH dehydrogenase FAD-containing subunit
VLVLGGGFAGSHVARELGDSGATIVNPGPLRMVCPRVELVVGFAVELHADRRLVGVESKAGAFSVAYAQLVVALGAHPALSRLRLPLDTHGRVQVDGTLRVLGAPNIWALGDCAAVPNDQHTLLQAHRLATNLRGTPRERRPA